MSSAPTDSQREMNARLDHFGSEMYWMMENIGKVIFYRIKYPVIDQFKAVISTKCSDG